MSMPNLPSSQWDSFNTEGVFNMNEFYMYDGIGDMQYNMGNMNMSNMNNMMGSNNNNMNNNNNNNINNINSINSMMGNNSFNSMNNMNLPININNMNNMNINKNMMPNNQYQQQQQQPNQSQQDLLISDMNDKNLRNIKDSLKGSDKPNLSIQSDFMMNNQDLHKFSSISTQFYGNMNNHDEQNFGGSGKNVFDTNYD